MRFFILQSQKGSVSSLVQIRRPCASHTSAASWRSSEGEPGQLGVALESKDDVLTLVAISSNRSFSTILSLRSLVMARFLRWRKRDQRRDAAPQDNRDAPLDLGLPLRLHVPGERSSWVSSRSPSGQKCQRGVATDFSIFLTASSFFLASSRLVQAEPVATFGAWDRTVAPCDCFHGRPLVLRRKGSGGTGTDDSSAIVGSTNRGSAGPVQGVGWGTMVLLSRSVGGGWGRRERPLRRQVDVFEHGPQGRATVLFHLCTMQSRRWLAA